MNPGELRHVLREARAAERSGNLDTRNALARKLFARRSARVVSAHGGEVETWWDASSQNWITATHDGDGNQIGDATLSGHRDDAAVAHLWALFNLFEQTPA
jgi:hypothetical protein